MSYNIEDSFGPNDDCPEDDNALGYTSDTVYIFDDNDAGNNSDSYP